MAHPGGAVRRQIRICVGGQSPRCAAPHADSKLAPCGIKSTQLMILAAIDRKGELSVNDLARIMVLDRTTTRKNLKPMEREGYLKSIVSKADRRYRAITLTAKGKGLLIRAYPLWRSAHEEFQRTHGAKFAENYRAMLREVTDIEGASSNAVPFDARERFTDWI